MVCTRPVDDGGPTRGPKREVAFDDNGVGLEYGTEFGPGIEFETHYLPVVVVVRPPGRVEIGSPVIGEDVASEGNGEGGGAIEVGVIV